MMHVRLLTFAALAGLVVVSSGCGRRSGLDTPYEAALQARKDAERAKQPLPPEPTPPPKDKPFFLDPLIK